MFSLLVKHSLKGCVVGRKMAPRRCPGPNLQNLWVFYLTWQKVLCRYDYGYGIGDGESRWITQVGPIKLHESLKTENLFQLGQKEKGKEIWSMRETWSTIDGFEDGRGPQTKEFGWPQNLGMVLCWGLARKWESQSYNCKETNSTNNPT